jgi:hypothetical protein
VSDHSYSEITPKYQAVTLDQHEQALVFLRHVLPPEGFGLYCLMTKRATGRVQNIFVSTIGALWHEIQERDRGGRGNVYFAIASFKDNSGREAANATALKAFIADVDIDLEKAAKGVCYATLKEAVEAIKRFCAATR